MADSISETSVALSLMLEALRLLDAPQHAQAAAHLRAAINELSSETPLQPPPSDAAECAGEY